MSPAVTLVLLNWNGLSFLQRFLPTVLATEYPNFQTLLVDNASTDASADWVEKHYPTVKVVRLDKNYGFAEGNNRALPYIQTPYFALVNTDVETPSGWLKPLVALLDNDPNIAAVQPKILADYDHNSFEYAGAAGGFIDTLGYPFCRGRIFDTLEKDNGQYDQARPVFWATGACLLLRTEAIKKTGLFDPEFFAHMEEIDLCWRLQNFGYSVWVEPASYVYHVGGGALPRSSPYKTYLNFRNSLMTMLKNLPLSQAIPKIFLRLVLDDVETARCILGGRWSHAKAIVQSHFDFYARVAYCREQQKNTRPQPLSNHKTVYQRSIVFDYFLMGKKYFSSLSFRSQSKG